MRIRVLIAEDEPLSRRTLRDFAAEIDWMEVVGEAADGAEAARLIDRLQPELVFLDIQMPELSGLDVLGRIRHRPAVVFTTAHEEHALAAFEWEALDYLLKPFGRERFRATMERVRRRLAPAPEPPLERVFVRRRGEMVPVNLAEVARLEAGDDYVTLHVEREQYLVTRTLTDFERRLDPARFRRVHRRHIVNLDHVVSLRPGLDPRRLVVTLRDGSEVAASRAGSRVLRTLVV
jgi:two-component system, LytTR family, response regulator